MGLESISQADIVMASFGALKNAAENPPACQPNPSYGLTPRMVWARGSGFSKAFVALKTG
jgi:hypothetical protein